MNEDEKEVELYGNGREVPVFCYRCGRKTIQLREHVGYSSMTGYSLYETTVRCPVWQAWIRGHTLRRFDAKGNEIVYTDYP